MLKWRFGDLNDISASAVHRVCNTELNYTHKVATKVAVGATARLTIIKRKIVLYMLAVLNLQGYIPVSIDQ